MTREEFAGVIDVVIDSLGLTPGSKKYHERMAGYRVERMNAIIEEKRNGG